MANFIIMSGYRRVSFQPCVSHVFCHSILEFPFGFTYVLLCTFGACDEIYQVVCGAVTTQITSVCVICVGAFEVFRFVHFRTVAAVGFVFFVFFVFLYSLYLLLFYQSSINFHFSPSLAGFPDILN